MTKKKGDARREMLSEVNAVLEKYPRYRGKLALAEIPAAPKGGSGKSKVLDIAVAKATKKVCVKWGINPANGKRVCLKWVDASTD